MSKRSFIFYCLLVLLLPACRAAEPGAAAQAPIATEAMSTATLAPSSSVEQPPPSATAEMVGDAPGPGTLVSQPLDPILAGPIEVTEITAQSALINVETTRDVACVVVYGEDKRFGQLALDQLMGNTAHSEHQVALRGLQPDTEYYYRFQGSDPEGNFYASEIRTFRTARAEESTSLGTNVATLERGAKIAEVSSNYGGGGNDSPFGANNAIDGDPATEWSSDGDGNDAFITVELPEPVEVSGFGLWTRTMGTSAQISRFEVENESGEVFGPFDLPDASGEYTFPANGSGQRFTFRVLDSTGGNTGVVEIAVYTPEG